MKLRMLGLVQPESRTLMSVTFRSRRNESRERSMTKLNKFVIRSRIDRNKRCKKAISTTGLGVVLLIGNGPGL